MIHKVICFEGEKVMKNHRKCNLVSIKSIYIYLIEMVGHFIRKKSS